MAPAKYTKAFFKKNAAFLKEFNELQQETTEFQFPVNLLPRMKFLQTLAWQTSAIQSGKTLLDWVIERENSEEFDPEVRLVSVGGVPHHSSLATDVLLAYRSRYVVHYR